MTKTDNIERVTAISNRTGSLDWHHCCKFKLHEGRPTFQDVCGELIGVVQDRSVQSPPYISDLLCGAFLYPADIDFRSNPNPGLHFAASITVWLLTVNTSHVQRPFFKHYSYFVLSKVCRSHPFTCLDFHDYSKNENQQRKNLNQQKFQCSRRPTASSRQSVTNQHRVCDVICNTLWVKQRIFPIYKQTQAISYLGANWRVAHANREPDLSAV